MCCLLKASPSCEADLDLCTADSALRLVMEVVKVTQFAHLRIDKNIIDISEKANITMKTLYPNFSASSDQLDDIKTVKQSRGRPRARSASRIISG